MELTNFDEVENWWKTDNKNQFSIEYIKRNILNQNDLYEAFKDAYLPDKENNLNKDYAAKNLLLALKKIIYLNSEAHKILNPNIKQESLEKTLKNSLEENKELKNFIVKYHENN